MADFGEVLGTLLTGLARARRIADEETAALAEYYSQQPLLAGMSVPRVRVPEMTVDLPVVVEAQEGAGEPDPGRVTEHVLAAVRQWADAISFTPPPTLLPAIDRALGPTLRAERIAREEAPGATIFRDRRVEIPQLAGRVAVETLGRISRRSFTDDQLDDLERRVHDATREETRLLGPPRMSINPLTHVVKETTDPSTVARLRISLKEEGLEWATIESEDGTQRRLLTPE